MRKLVDTYKDEDVSITVMGHNLWVALATLSAFCIAENCQKRRSRVGAADFKKRFDVAMASAVATPETSFPGTQRCCAMT